MPRRSLLVFFVVSLMAVAGPRIAPGPGFEAVAATTGAAAETREKLKALREQIGSVQDRLAAERQRRDRASHELARTEQRLGQVAGRISALDERITETRKRLDRLSERRRDLEGELERHRETLAAQVRAAYRLGRRPALQLLLGQDDIAGVSRALGYYGYFNEARIGAMERANALLSELEDVTREARTAERQLDADRTAIAARRRELERVRQQRQQLVAQLDRSIESGDARLARLQDSRRRLQRLLDDLGAVLGDIPAAPLAEQPFASRAGELTWPVTGAPRARFGAARADGRMEWRGMWIGAEAGAPVRAVYHGRVVFADWLSGFGQLLIIDHLDGHMTLYGFNQQLLRGSGDWVSPGEPVAAVGQSGGRDRPGLYFEIRSGGKPVDPLPWLTAR